MGEELCRHMRAPVSHCYCGEAVTCRVQCGIYPALDALAGPTVGPPLALKMCAGCTRQYAVEGDVGDEQGGSPWFCPHCPVPPKYADAMIRDAARRLTP